MLHVLQIEEIETLLLEIPDLVSLYERRDPTFPDGVLRWLVRTESVLGNCRLPAAAELAALRSRLVGAGRGSVPAEVSLRGRVTRRRLRDASAAAVLDKAGAFVQAAIADGRTRVAEAGRLLRQALAVAQQKGYDLRQGDSGQGGRPASFLATLRQDSDLAAVVTHVVGLVGSQDATILLDRSLTALLTTTPA